MDKLEQGKSEKDITFTATNILKSSANNLKLYYCFNRKTFTMEGLLDQEEHKGMMPRSFDQIFNHINNNAGNNEQWLVRGSFLEIYNDEVLDLLSTSTDLNQRLEVKENPDSGVYVKGLESFVVKSVGELNKLLIHGKKNRKTGSTLMNRESSRSHCIFCVQIEQSALGPDNEQHIRSGKLNLVDLAGSERQGKTGAEGAQLKEAAKINLALSALGNVIHALTNPNKDHIPYRDSKLTRLLQDSLGGNTKTVMVANIGPADYNFEETVNTLRFANRAKNIKNQPKINEDPKDAMLREFQSEIERLKAQLAAEEALSAGLPIPPEIAAQLSKNGGMRGSSGASSMVQGPPRTVIVEKVVEKVIETGISSKEYNRLREEAQQKRSELQYEADREKEAIESERAALEQKQQEIESELTLTAADVEQKRQDRLALKAKLKAVEAKLLVGKKILDTAEKQEKIIQQNKLELLRQRQLEERVQAELREKEQFQLDLAEKYETLDKEVAAKSTKLNKLLGKYMEQKQEIEDIATCNNKEREELLETIRELTKHIALKDFVLFHFVPPEEIDKINERAAWDDQTENYLLQHTDSSRLNAEIGKPKSAKNAPRPISEFARLQLAQQQLNNPGNKGDNGQARFKNENILDLELDLPDRTTQDYATLQAQLAQQQQQLQANQFDHFNLMNINLNNIHNQSHLHTNNANEEQYYSQQSLANSPPNQGRIDPSLSNFMAQQQAATRGTRPGTAGKRR
jgi:hypothetical protein